MAADNEQVRTSQLTIPPQLLAGGGLEFPSMTPEVIADIHDAGWSGVGVALAIFDQNGSLMIAEHKITDKNPVLGWGPNSETVQSSPERTEHFLDTAARCITEELGEDPIALGLRWYGNRRFSVSRWKRPHQDILAINVPLAMPKSTSQRLLANPPDTREISRVRFLSRAQIERIPNLRDGTSGWLQHLGYLGLFDGQLVGDVVPFPAVQQDAALKDTDVARFAVPARVLRPQVA